MEGVILVSVPLFLFSVSQNFFTVDFPQLILLDVTESYRMILIGVESSEIVYIMHLNIYLTEHFFCTFSIS